MERETLQRTLQDGILAIKSGDRVRGRELLLQVVEHDDQLEPAWLWLSTVMDDPADQLTALENALTLNPNNSHAQGQARSLRVQLGLEHEPPPPPPAPLEPAPAPIPIPAIDPVEDPLQCPHCGKLTQDTDKRCPHCRRSLLIPGKWDHKGWYRNLLVVSGVYAQTALLQNIGATLAMALSYGLDPYLPGIIARLPFTTLIFGDFLDWDPNLGVALFGAAILRIAALLVLIVMFYTDMESAADFAIGLSLLDLAWTTAAYTMFGFPGRVPAIVNAALAGLVLLLALLARMARLRGYVRQWTQIDRNAQAPLTLYKHGHDYALQGKWALATLHWRRAVAFRPNEAQYHKDLGLAQAQLGRYEAALDALRAGAKAAPDDDEFRTLIAAVEGRMRKAKQ